MSDCLKDGCDYAFSMNAVISSSQRVLHLDVGYAGELKLMESIYISEVHLNLKGAIYVITLRIPVEIEGPKWITLNIPHNSVSSWQKEESSSNLVTE